MLRGERGSWEGVWHGLTYPEHGGDNHHILLTGVGWHQGRSALLYVTHADGAGHLVVEVLTTNLGSASWGRVFDGATVAAAMLDRLLHRWVVFDIDGDCYR